MRLKHYILSMLVAFISACGSGGDDSVKEQGGSPTDSASSEKSVCMLVEGSEICGPASLSGKSGERLEVKVQGELPDGYSLRWSIDQVEGVKTPLIYADEGVRGYIILPRVDKDEVLNLTIAAVSDGAEEVNGALDSLLNVAEADSLTLNGITSVYLNEAGLLSVDWLPAVNSAGQAAVDAIYTISATKLVNGELSGDTTEISSDSTYEEIAVELGSTYRLILHAADANGVITYAEHLDFTVPESVPALLPVVTIPSGTIPEPSNYEENTLLNISDVIHVVRLTGDGSTKVITRAMEHERYSDAAPFVLSTRFKSLTEEEMLAYSSMAQANTVGGITTLELGNFEITFPEVNVASGKSTSSMDNYRCLALALGDGVVGDGKVSACLDKSSTMSCDIKTELSTNPKETQICKGALGAKLSGSVKSVFKGEVLWPVGALKVGLDKKTGNNSGKSVEVALNPGAKFAYEFGNITAGTGFKISQTFTSTYINEYDGLLPNISMDIKFGKNKVLTPLPGKDSLYWYNTDLLGVKLPVNIEVSLGIFPKIEAIKTIGAEASIAGRVNVNGAVKFLRGGVLSSPSVVDAKIYLDPHLDAKAYLNLPWNITAEIERKFLTDTKYRWNIYQHPRNIKISIESVRQCKGGYTYTGDLPVMAVPEYGMLEKGGTYGMGWFVNDKITFPYSGTFRLDSFSSNGDGASYVRFSRSSTGNKDVLRSEYDDVYGRPKTVLNRIFKFINKGHWAGEFFPTYVVFSDRINFGQAQFPWVCWGSSLTNPTEDSGGTFTFPLEMALWIEGD